MKIKSEILSLMFAVLCCGFANAQGLTPTVTGVSPNTSWNKGSISVEIDGSNFEDNATVKLSMTGQPDIIATDVSVWYDSALGCTLPLVGVAVGAWDVTVTNPEGQSATLPGGFTIVSTPTISSVMPNSSSNKADASQIQIEGDWFEDGAIVKLVKDGQPDIIAVNASVLAENLIVCDFPTSGTATGLWDVMVTNPSDGHSAKLASSFWIYADEWATAAPMSQSRYSQVGVQLLDGKVFVVGGGAASAEIYSIADGWTTAAAMSQLRNQHGAALMNNGNVLVAGGRDNNWNSTLALSEIYNPATNTWTGTGSMIQGRYNYTLTVLMSGKILAAGGEHYDPYNPTLGNAEIYDPDAGTWTQTGTLSHPVSQHTATLLPDGRVLVAGGYIRGLGGMNYAQIYNPDTGQWNAVSNMSYGRMGHTAVLLPGNKVLVAGGVSQNSPAEIYDVANDTWTETKPPMRSHSADTAVLLPSGDVLVAGSQGSEIYNSGSNTWFLTAPMQQPRDNYVAALLPDGDVLAAGEGSSVEIYKPRSAPPVFSVISIAPNVVSGDSAKISIHGTGLAAITTVKLTGAGQPDIMAVVRFVTPNHIVCDLDISNAVSGWRDISIVTADGTVTLAHALAIAPSIVSITPNTASNSADIDMVEIEGTGFMEGATVKLAKAGQPDITASNVTVLASNLIVCSLPITGTADGEWDVAVVNPNGLSATLARGIRIGGYWLPVASMPQPRQQHTATLLADGKLLVAGGWGDVWAYAASVIYDPAADGWTDTGAMSVGRYEQSAVLLTNGDVLVSGGWDENGNLVAPAEIYNSTAGVWSIAGSMTTPRASHTTTLLPDGKVLTVGGYDANGNAITSSELYDPATGVWTSTGPIAHARYRHTASLLPNGKVMICGGTAAASPWPSTAMSSAELYDPTTGSWSDIASMYGDRTKHAATLLADGKVLVDGGNDMHSDILNSAEVYDPATGFWSMAGSMTQARRYHTTALLPDGKVLAAGGQGDGGPTLASAELYNPASGNWIATLPMAQARISHTMTMLANGKAMTVGGSDDAGATSASAEIYKASSFFAPSIASVSPNSAPANSNIDQFIVNGANFSSGITVKLTKAGQAPITAANVIVLTPVQLTCSLPVANAAPGVWNVVVVNSSGQSAILADAFTVEGIAGPNVAVSHSTAALVNSFALSETLRAENISLSGITSTGTLAGAVTYSSFTVVTVQSGGFAGKGFARAAWQAVLGGASHSGALKTMSVYTVADGKIHIKGATTGDITGTFDGYISETSPGSGTYDKYYGVWNYDRIKGASSFGTLYLSGTASRISMQDYSSVNLKLLQENIAGSISGYLSGFLNATLTHLRVNDSGNPYFNEGCMILSYRDSQGSGAGWAYAVKSSTTSPVSLTGLFDNPANGLLTGILNDTASPNTFALTIESMDAGQTPAPNLKVNVYATRGVSPGQVVSEELELINDGSSTAQNMDLVAVSIPYADFVAASGNYKQVDLPTAYGTIPVVRWSFPEIPPKSVFRVNAQYKMRTFIGSAHEQLEGRIFLMPTDKADAAIPTIDIKESYDEY